MKIYLCQTTHEVGTPLLTASENVAKHYIEYLQKKGIKGYVYLYEVKTQGKNIEDFAVAQYFKETEEPF